MPEEAMRREIKDAPSLMDLAALKPRWGVSIQALIVRAFDLGYLTDRQYRYFFEQISKMGWRKSEPKEFDIKSEKPRLLSKLAEVAYGSSLTPQKIADLASIPTSMAEQILAGYAMKSDLPKIPTQDEPQLEAAIEPRNNLLTFSRKR